MGEGISKGFGFGCGCLLFIIFLIAILMFLVSCSSDSGAEFKEPISVDAMDLGQAYTLNDVGADVKYKDRYVNVTGKVTKIDSEGSGFKVHLESGISRRKDSSFWAQLAGDKEMIGYIRCRFPDSRAEQVADITPGDVVTLVGIGEGMDDHIDLKDCMVRED